MTHYKSNGSSVDFSRLVLLPTGEMSGRRRVYQLGAPFWVYITADGLQHTIRVPQSFASDLATIPTVAQILIGNRDAPGVAECSVVHDWLCHVNAPRELANTTMWWLLLATGVPRWKATAIYLALMVFGYKSPWSRLWRWIGSISPMET